MIYLNPPLSKEDFINSGWKEVIDNSERKLCNIYYDNFRRKAQEIKDAGNDRQCAVFEILQRVTVAPIQLDLDISYSTFSDRFTDETIEFLAEIVDEVSDPELQAQIAEILWFKDKKRNYSMGHLAVHSYLESAKKLEDPQKWSRYFDRIKKSLTLGLKINYNPEIVVEYIDDVLNRYQGQDPLWLSVKLHELLQEKKTVNFLRNKQILDTPKYVDLANKGATFAESSGEWDKARKWWEIKAKWHHIEKNYEKLYKAKILGAETYIKEAEDSLVKHPTPYLKASHDLQRAFEAFERLKSQATDEERTVIDTKLEEIHKLLLEYQQQSSNELITIYSEFNISEEIELAISQVKGKKFSEAILALALLGSPQKVLDLRQMAEKNSLLSQFMPVEIKNDMGKIVARQPIEPDKAEEAVIFDMYRIANNAHRCHAQAFIEPARKQIVLENITGKSKEEDKITEKDLLELVINNPFVPEGREYLFAKGLYAGLTGDFITATHILIPQIENSVRYLLSSRGAITSGIDNKNNGIQKEDNLNSTLYPSKYPEITSIFDEDTLFDLQGLLIEHAGSNLRNKMAHGLISDDDFCSSTFSYLWWLTLRLCFGIGILVPQEIVEESNPFIKFAGMFKDDPLFDEFVEEMDKNRRELDEEIAGYEACSEGNNVA
ncbi:hypothetical protein B6N60_01336 [Richelia sinica FACHB-800]|uniref:DUF4209 domain-containing protein n=1 Tax=Richelia sinica FACHB-800 TaxID=1357546 RepID=A0A975Y3Z5_9NOST|nr:DUF4209 domain-containing protein [Richelia sinica]MBD2663773.1 DUF4209 domain-containing protein [Richelia sinica FACHB-800]QXE22650.1 hypothetical protein B6N60_01336 [Richelia sinica FACHB-800]